MAFHGWPISQCQSPSTPLASQLLGGVRVIDVRLAVIPPPSDTSTSSALNATRPQELIAYHGLWPQQTPFTAILNDVHAFLTSPIGLKETIVMSIKQEDFAITPAPLFSQLVRETIVRGPGGWSESSAENWGVNKGMWFLENRIPKLGQVRGKVVLLSRFGGNGDGWDRGLEGLGIHPTTWPDSEKKGFEWELKGTLVRTHDWYVVLFLPNEDPTYSYLQVRNTDIFLHSRESSACSCKPPPSTRCTPTNPFNYIFLCCLLPTGTSTYGSQGFRVAKVGPWSGRC